MPKPLAIAHDEGTCPPFNVDEFSQVGVILEDGTEISYKQLAMIINDIAHALRVGDLGSSARKSYAPALEQVATFLQIL